MIYIVFNFEKQRLVGCATIVLFFGISVIPTMVSERPVLIETIYVDDNNTEGLFYGAQGHGCGIHFNELIENNCYPCM